MVPATAVPRDEPRLEMQRDKPEISPCCSSPNADCTTLTDGVSITPTPRPSSSNPGAKAQALGDHLTSARSTATPMMVATKPAMISVRCAYFLAEALGGERRHQDAAGRRGEDHARLDRVVAANNLEVCRDDERSSDEQQPLHVLRDEAEVRGAVSKQGSGEPAAPRHGTSAPKPTTRRAPPGSSRTTTNHEPPACSAPMIDTGQLRWSPTSCPASASCRMASAKPDGSTRPSTSAGHPTSPTAANSPSSTTAFSHSSSTSPSSTTAIGDSSRLSRPGQGTGAARTSSRRHGPARTVSRVTSSSSIWPPRDPRATSGSRALSSGTHLDAGRPAGTRTV